MPNARIFGPQHWNAIAKDIRTEMSQKIGETEDYQEFRKLVLRTLSDLALRLAVRFEIDNASFDPIRFLEQCSPDNKAFPLIELWEEPIDAD